MSSIDERIVALQLQNSQFSKAAADSLGVLARLKAGLNMDSAQASLAGLQRTAGEFTLGAIGDGADRVSAKVTAVGVAGVAALASIATQALATGQALLASVTSDPIMAGFNEYELKMGSIQTILSNTAKAGTTLDQVKASLEELNKYADKTIYNFGDMTRNIGLFTNAGIGLEDATSMIKGFSNEAAASGTTSSAAAGAAYQLSQALSAGTVRLIDWRSLQTVGMGNKNMQQGILDIATAMGTLDAAGVSSEEITQDFNGSLEKGWLSADVMSAYLRIMAGDMDAAGQAALGLNADQIAMFATQQANAEASATKVRTWTQLIGTLREGVGSSWAQTFELILGDFDKATELFSYMKDVLEPILAASGDQRNAMLQGWNDLGGRTAAFEALKNVFDALMKIMTPIREAFQEIFPPSTGEALTAISMAVRDFTARLIISDQAAANLKATFKGIFAFFSIGISIIKGILSVFFRLIGAIFSLTGGDGGGFLALTAQIGTWLVKLNEVIQNSGAIMKFFGFLGDVLTDVVGAIRSFVGWLISLAAELLNIQPDFSSVLGFFDSLVDKVMNLKNIRLDFSWVGDLFGRLADRLNVFRPIADFFIAIWEKLTPVFQALAQVLKPITDAFAEFFGKIADFFTNAVQTGDFAPLFDLLNVGLLGALVLFVKKFLDKAGGLADAATGGIKDAIVSTFGALNDTMKAMQTDIKAGALMKIAIAIALLTASVLVLSLIDSVKLAQALTAMGVLFAQLVGSMALFEKYAMGPGIAKMPILTASLILLGIAMNFIAAAVVKLASLSWNELLKGMLGLGVSIAILSKGVNAIGETSGNAIRGAAAIVILGVAMNILAEAVKKLGQLSFGEMIQGLIGLGVVLGALVAFLNLAKIDATTAISAVGLLGLASSILLLSQAVKVFAGLNPEQLVAGLAAVGITLALINGFLNRVGNPANFIATATGLVILSGALLIISQVVSIFAGMPLDQLAQGLGALGFALFALTKATTAMPPNMPVIAAGLLILGVALLAISGAIQILGGIPIENLIVGLGGMAAALLILGIAVNSMSGSLTGAAALFVIAGAMALLAPAILLLGMAPLDQLAIGLGALAVGLGILVVAGYAATGAIPGLIAIAAAVLALGIATALAGVGVLAMGAGVLMFATALAILGTIGAAGAESITLVLAAIIASIPAFLVAIAQGIVGFAAVIVSGAPAITAAFVAMLASLITAIATTGPLLITTVKDLLLQLIASLTEVIPPLIEFAVLFIVTLVDALVVLIPKLVDAGLQIVTGILEGIASNIQGIVEAGFDIVIKFMDGISAKIPDLIQAAIDMVISFIEGLAQGIRDNTDRVNAATADLADAIIDGLVDGVMNGIDVVANAARDLANGAIEAAKNMFNINSPSKVFRSMGYSVGEGLEDGIRGGTDGVVSETERMASSSIKAMKDTMTRLNDAVATNMDGAPVIRPVLDMTNVKKGAQAVNGMFLSPQLRTDVAYGRASNVAREYRGLPAYTGSPEGSEVTKNETKVEYNQYNTSPKAIPATELYRRTNNQISQVREALKVK